MFYLAECFCQEVFQMTIQRFASRREVVEEPIEVWVLFAKNFFMSGSNFLLGNHSSTRSCAFAHFLNNPLIQVARLRNL
jgi:hypothetical protein